MVSQHYLRLIRRFSTRSIHNVGEVSQAEKSQIPLDVRPKIGLEVHCQLNTNSKLFSQGANDSQASPNTQLDLLDISLPGTLPKLNFAAIRSAIFTALGLNCHVQDAIHFDRKNYFYTDMPAGYQITQYNKPIAINGYLDFLVTTYHHSVIAHSQPYDIIKYLYADNRTALEEFEPYMKRSKIQQIQLEQDSAKTLSQTTADGKELNNLVDYNRCGSALIEIVFEPDLTSPHEASSLIRELIMILKTLNVCDCELQEGSLRVDANVSINSINGEQKDPDFAKRVELKNLNSLRSLNRGIKAEIQRQAIELMLGNKIVQESRSYDSRSNMTIPLRLKEDSVDYRYMPEPNLPLLKIDTKLVEEMRAKLPVAEFPGVLRESLRDKYSLDYLLIVNILDEPGLSLYFEKIMEASGRYIQYEPDTVADFLIYAIANLKRVEVSPIDIDLTKLDEGFWRRFSPEKMHTLFDLLFEDKLSYSNALEVMKCMLLGNDESTPIGIIENLNLYTITDDEEIEIACKNLFLGMKNISKKFFRFGDRKYVRLMLYKLVELHNGRLSARKAIDFMNKAREERNALKNRS